LPVLYNRLLEEILVSTFFCLRKHWKQLKQLQILCRVHF
jgi:hypothetical protein